MDATWLGGTALGLLVSAQNHGVDRVDGDRHEDPADGGDEEAAGDLPDRMGGEEAVGGGAALLGREWGCLHCSTSIGRVGQGFRRPYPSKGSGDVPVCVFRRV